MIELLSKIDVSEFVIKRASSKLSSDRLFERISDINRTKSATVQVFDYESVADKTHLIGAYINALSAFKSHSNKTKNPAMEMLLFAAMTDQISTAINTIGAKKNSNFVIFSSSKSGFDRIKPLLTNIKEFRPTKQHTSKALKKFGISNTKDADKLLLQKMAVSRLRL